MAKRRFPKGTTVVLAGTKRGLYLLHSKDRVTWKNEGSILDGGRIYNAALDQRSAPRIHAADNQDIFGVTTRYSDDFGATWNEPRTPIRFEKSSGRRLENIWIIEPGRASEPDVVYAGVDPASLWVSRDRGETWSLNEGLEGHRTRKDWEPGLGGLCLHSIVPDPTDANRMWVAISAVGVLRTDDGGRAWQLQNKGVPARHRPKEYPEFGQCVHRLLVDPSNPERLVQQNHWGLFSTEDGGGVWQDIQGNVPSYFGFPMAMDPGNAKRLFIVPQTPGDEGRHNIGDQFAVWRTDAGGTKWKKLVKGLPKGPQVRLGVLRHALSTDAHDPCGVYVGTNTGQLFASADTGDSWQLIADFMPQIFSIRTSVID